MVKTRLFELQQFEVPLIGIKVRTHRLREYGVCMANFDKFPFNIHCNVIYFNRNQFCINSSNNETVLFKSVHVVSQC